MNSYAPSSPFSDSLDTLHFPSDAGSSPYSSSSSSHHANEQAPSPFAEPFPTSFDTPLPAPAAASQMSWSNTNMTWPTQLTQHMQHSNHMQQQQHPTYHTEHNQQYQQQQQQQQQYYPTAVSYASNVAPHSYHPAAQHPAPAVYEHNHYVEKQSNLHPNAVPAFVLPSTLSDPGSPTPFYALPDSAAPSTPPPPPIKFGDVFRGATLDMVLRHSQPVRPLNHAQMRVWQQFESGDTVRSISDHMGLKPNVVLNYIIYALESYSPSPSHPVFIHWPRFSIPPELMERVSAAMIRVGGQLGRLDVVKERLEGGAALDEDLRIAMLRWKMERALGAAYKQWDMYRVMSAEEAAERLDRQRQEDVGDEAGGVDNDETKEGNKRVEEEKDNGSDPSLATESDQPMRDNSNEAKQPPQPSQPPAVTQHTIDEYEKRKEGALHDTMVANAAEKPTHPPLLNASEVLFQLSLNGGTSQRCFIGMFQRDWTEIEAVLNKLIADQLAWKRGLLYCPS